MGFAFVIKQYIKSAVQNIWLPGLYKKYAKNPVNPRKVIFADAHSDTVPASMEPVYEYFMQDNMNHATDADDAQDNMNYATDADEAENPKHVSDMDEAGENPKHVSDMDEAHGNPGTGKWEVVNFCADFAGMTKRELKNHLKSFMREYAEARYVFISGYFLPVSSCRKRQETTVVQLWHSGGLMKKMAYDTTEDIPKYYRGKVTANYDIVTVSADICVPVWAKAFRIDEKTVKPTGLVRTDKYYDRKWNDDCREKFFAAYPEARGKKIAVYAPTFKGNAGIPYATGLRQVVNVRERLKDDWFILIKLHPHLDKGYPEFHSELKTEEAFAAADLMITDYSSVLYDWLIYRKPFVLFAPDLQEYEEGRGLYIDYRSLPAPVVQTETELCDLLHIYPAWDEKYTDKLEECFELYMGACDGHARDRLLSELGLDAGCTYPS